MRDDSGFLPVVFGHPMLILLCLCVGALLLNLLIQLAAIFTGARFATRLRDRQHTLIEQIRVLGVMVTLLFLGHLLQIGVWAALFRAFGQFDHFGDAFYHSTVNYSSLGYGDIVMEPPWRLAGALEASVGVMMFGVSTATLFAAVSRMFQQHLKGPGDPPKG
ncbi:potassium channel family protein [Haloferula sp. A504]|uniref:potassium channel family protein n=1 Tax=Haloferula sp. A504 TaxID=3373601 RepID=UPI0031C4D2A3|nr:potassium channel family protein [Verrucomicrobiaceae bacterium E54]